MAEYFFELLTEEIPASMLPHPNLGNGIVPLLNYELGMAVPREHPPFRIDYTPRRIAFVLHELPSKQPDREHEVKGPPTKVAYDSSGDPSQALRGFLKKNSATTEDVVDGGDYVLLRRTIPGLLTAEILQHRIPEIVESLRWPKMMRWGKGEQSYIRPVHSIVSILEGEHLPIVVLGVASATVTRGHRTLAPQLIEVRSY